MTKKTHKEALRLLNTIDRLTKWVEENRSDDWISVISHEQLGPELLKDMKSSLLSLACIELDTLEDRWENL